MLSAAVERGMQSNRTAPRYTETCLTGLPASARSLALPASPASQHDTRHLDM